MRCFVSHASCHVTPKYKCYQQTSTTTNVVADTAYLSASALSSTRTTVADGHKFSAVTRLSRRLLDRSLKRHFYLLHQHLRPSLRMIQLEFHQVLWHQETRDPGYLLYGAVCVILDHFGIILACDGRTDRRIQYIPR